MKNNDTFITNFDKEKFGMYQRAIMLHSDSDLYIEAEAYDVYGRRMKDLFSLHCYTRKDLSRFWDLFGKLNEIEDIKKDIEKSSEKLDKKKQEIKDILRKGDKQ